MSAIADIFKLQTGYNLHDKFNDQTNWKDAFDIANAFAETSEKHRANQENLATSANRVNQMNANFLEQTAKSNLARTKTVAEQQLADFFQQNAVDELGRVRTSEELFNFARENPNLNPFAFLQAMKNYQNYANSLAQETAPVDPQYAAEARYLAGLSPITINQDGTPVIASTDTALPPFASAEALERFAAGKLGAYQDALYKMQQQAEREKAVQEARLPYTLAAIEARSDAAQAKQNNWREYQDEKSLNKAVDGLMDTILINSNFNESKDFNALLSQANQILAKSDPALRPLILARLQAVAANQGIATPAERAK